MSVTYRNEKAVGMYVDDMYLGQFNHFTTSGGFAIIVRDQPVVQCVCSLFPQFSRTGGGS